MEKGEQSRRPAGQEGPPATAGRQAIRKRTGARPRKLAQLAARPQ